MSQCLSLAVLTRGRPGKTESRGMTYLDVWSGGTFFCTVVKRLSESKKRRQDCLMSSCSTVRACKLVAHSLTCCFPGTVPLLRTSRYMYVIPSLVPRPLSEKSRRVQKEFNQLLNHVLMFTRASGNWMCDQPAICSTCVWAIGSWSNVGSVPSVWR